MRRSWWAFRWLRESAPQFDRLDGAQETLTSYGDETDLDQTLVATLTSVLSDTKVNTVRYGLVLEDTVHANPAWRALEPEQAIEEMARSQLGRVLNAEEIELIAGFLRTLTGEYRGATLSDPAGPSS